MQRSPPRRLAVSYSSDARERSAFHSAVHGQVLAHGAASRRGCPGHRRPAFGHPAPRIRCSCGGPVQAFYIQTYHLKDSLKDASATTGISPQAIEDEITNNSDLALLADLANLDKHFRLSKKPRSDDAPKIVGVRGITRTGESSPEGWRLGVVIEHKGQRLDGRDIAKRSIAAWHDALQRWHLL